MVRAHKKGGRGRESFEQMELYFHSAVEIGVAVSSGKKFSFVGIFTSWRHVNIFTACTV